MLISLVEIVLGKIAIKKCLHNKYYELVNLFIYNNRKKMRHKFKKIKESLNNIIDNS